MITISSARVIVSGQKASRLQVDKTIMEMLVEGDDVLNRDK